LTPVETGFKSKLGSSTGKLLVFCLFMLTLAMRGSQYSMRQYKLFHGISFCGCVREIEG
jgi:hypothetical protein